MVYPGASRGRTDAGWLQARHSFSFGEYHDPERMGFGSLRVINDDRVAPGGGFPTHGHRAMEIITIVLEGELSHTDSLGHTQSLRPGEVQVMSAGRGIRHSEFNASRTTPVHLLQIWIVPERAGLPPAYAQRAFPDRVDRLCRVAGKAGADDGALPINQDAHVYVGQLSGGASVTHALAPGRRAWVHAATGALAVNGHRLSAGDAAAVESVGELVLTGGPGEVVVFDLA